jgi:TetR/AcrR family transcriptional regulator, cholesterol catabolism regulator
MSTENSSTRERILLEAARLFKKQGYENTSQREIAGLANIKAGSIYYHFGSKEDILVEVLDKGIECVFCAIRAKVENLPPGTGSRQVLAAAIEGHLNGVFQFGDYSSANIRTYRQAPETARSRHRKLRQEYSDYWRQILERVQSDLSPSQDIDITQRFLLNALNVTIEWFVPDGDDKEFERFVETVTENILFGLLSE